MDAGDDQRLDLEYTFENAIAVDTVAFAVIVSRRTSRTSCRCRAISASRRKAPTSSRSATTSPRPWRRPSSAWRTPTSSGDGNDLAFELTEGSFAAGIDLAGISAEEVTIQYTNATTSVDATEIGVADLTYTFDNAIAANTIAFVARVQRERCDSGLSGDLGFSKIDSDIVAVGNDVSASPAAGPVFVRLNEADWSRGRRRQHRSN